MQSTTSTTDITTPTFPVVRTLHRQTEGGRKVFYPKAIELATQAADSLQVFADRLQQQIGGGSADDLPLRLMFSVLKTREKLKAEILAAWEGA